MVFVRVHLIKGRLSAAQKDELGAKLVQAVADVEGLVNNEQHKETSWVQFYEFEPENWYAPANLAGANPDSRIQLDVIAPTRPNQRRTTRDLGTGGTWHAGEPKTGIGSADLSFWLQRDLLPFLVVACQFGWPTAQPLSLSEAPNRDSIENLLAPAAVATFVDAQLAS
jgi:phenylpyruvate tautomerase PptA (4-oxalocrotonate tautomerase family)